MVCWRDMGESSWMGFCLWLGGSGVRFRMWFVSLNTVPVSYNYVSVYFVV